MARRGPEMVDGARDPGSMAQREDPQTEAPRADLDFLGAGLGAAAGLPVATPAHEAGAPVVVKFESKHAGHRFLLKLGERVGINDQMIPITTDVQFVSGAYQTSDPKIVGILRAHRQFNSEFWDAGVRANEKRRKAAEVMLTEVELLPDDLKDALRAKLGMTEFALPPVVAADTETAPPAA